MSNGARASIQRGSPYITLLHLDHAEKGVLRYSGTLFFTILILWHAASSFFGLNFVSGKVGSTFRNIRSCKNHEGGSFWSVRHPSGTGVGRVRCRTGAGRVPDAKRRSRAFKQKKVYQNRTIIKEVMSKNVRPAPVLDAVPDGCRMGTGRVPDGCWTQRGDQELSNKKKFIKIGPLLRKLWAKMSIQHQCQTRCRMGARRVPDGCRTQRGDQELSNKKKFIKIGPLLRKLWPKMCASTSASAMCKLLCANWLCKLVCAKWHFCF